MDLNVNNFICMTSVGRMYSVEMGRVNNVYRVGNVGAGTLWEESTPKPARARPDLIDFFENLT